MSRSTLKFTVQAGLFVGLITLDLIYLTEQLPTANQKIVALDSTLAAGGPATNAAVAFRVLGNSATVMGVAGQHPLTQIAIADLAQQQVAIADLNPAWTDPLPTSSILVTRTTGERAVVSLNATRTQASPHQMPPDCWQGMQVVLVDGHQMAVGQAIARQAREQGIPVIADCGSWKPGFEQVLPWVDYAICSANFLPPDCAVVEAIHPGDPVMQAKRVGDRLSAFGIPHIAVTQGGSPIQVFSQGQHIQIPVPSIRPVDTLGAGDILHGAFCHFILETQDFTDALTQAAAIASRSCQFFGTRQWIEHR